MGLWVGFPALAGQRTGPRACRTQCLGTEIGKSVHRTCQLCEVTSSALQMDSETWPARTSAELNLRDRFLGGVGKKWLNCFARQRGTQWANASQNNVSQPGRNWWSVLWCSAEDPGSGPVLGRSPGEWHDNPLQYFCLQNPIDTGARWAVVHRVTKSRTQPKQLSTHT